MAVENVNNYQVNPYQMQQGFQMPVNNQSSYGELIDLKEHPDCFEYVYKKPASTGKKFGVGVASAFLPGLGQAINGEWGKGLAYFGGTILASTAAFMLFYPNIKSAKTMNDILKILEKGGNRAALASNIARWAVAGFAVFDAMRNAKSKETVIVPKQQANYPLG